MKRWQLTGLILLLSLVLFFSACAALSNDDDEDDSAGDDDNGDDDQVAEQTTIYDLQQGNVEPETRVALTEVVVSSPMAEDADGFFIMEQEGGAYSGIYVFVTGEASGEISPVVGDVVNVAGEYSEYYDLSELALSAVGDYEVVDHIGSAAPTDVNPADLVTDSPDAERWEGVLVRIEDVEVIDENPDAPSDFGEFLVTGNVRVDDMFFPEGNDPNPPLGTQFDALVGLFTYSFENFKLCPRDEDDFDGDWEPPVTGDDDATDTTIYDVQDGTVGEGATVTVTGIVTSPTDWKGETFFIQDENGGEYSGVAVYLWSEVAAVYDGEMGDVLRITGEVDEFFDLTEIVVKNVDDLEIVDSGDVPDPEEVDLDDIDEPWEGVLIQVNDVTVTAEPNEYGEFVVDDDLFVDDLFFPKNYWSEEYGISAGDEFSSIAGVLFYGYGEYKLEPRQDADLVE